MFILILGDVGSGKTLLMSIFGYLSKRDTIACNYTLRLPDKKIIALKPRILFDNTVKKDYLVLCDEIYTVIEARSFNQDRNKQFSYLLFQSRKKNIDIIGTAQLVITVDIRFREFLKKANSVIVYAERIDTFNNSNKNGFKYTFYSKKGRAQIFLSENIARKFFGIYDTNEIISMEKDTNPIDIHTALNYVEIIKNLYPINEKVTKSKVRLLCLENEITSTKTIDYIYLKMLNPDFGKQLSDVT